MAPSPAPARDQPTSDPGVSLDQAISVFMEDLAIRKVASLAMTALVTATQVEAERRVRGVPS